MKHTAGNTEQRPTFGPWPKGEYLLRVVDAKEKTSKSKNQMIELRLRVVKDGDVKGGGIFDYLVQSDGAAWKIDSFLQSAGKHLGEGEPIEIDANDLIGLEIHAKLRVGKDNHGDERNEVEDYFTPEGF